MTDRRTVELTSRQQDLLIQGLGYIRSSVKLRREDPSPEVSHKRLEQLEELLELCSLIEGTSHTEMVLQS